MNSIRYFLAVFTGLLLFIVPAAAQTLTFDVTDAPCHNGAGGSIDLSVAGGTPPLSYLWSNNAVTEDLDNLPAGVYSVTVTDGTGATITGSSTVNEPAALELSTMVNNHSCFGESNASITLSVSGGTAPYSYAWTSGAQTQNLDGRTAGTYTVTVTDASGCTATTSATVEPVQMLSLSGSTTNPSCSGMANGAIDLTVTGGTAPYSYQWSNGTTQEDQNNILAGTYYVTVVDVNACYTSASYPLQNLQNLNIVPTIVRPTCGNNDGMVTLNVSGGTPPYSYNWSNGVTTAVVSGLASGNYTVTVMDAVGCTKTATVGVTTFQMINSTVFRNCAYDVTVYAGTTHPPYTHLWSNGATTYFNDGIPPGTYSYTITDAVGCTDSFTFNLPPPAPLIAGIEKTDGVCKGTLFAYGVNFTPLYYKWSTGAQTAKISNIPPGTYTVTLTSGTGCTTTSSITTTEPIAYVFLYVTDTVSQVTCASPNSGAINVGVSSTAPPYSFQWSNGATTQNVANLSAGTYTLTVSDANGCMSTVTRSLPPPSYPVITLDTNTSPGCTTTGLLGISVTGGVPPFTYAWSNGITTQDIPINTPGSYTVTVTGANACTATATYNVEAPPAISVTIIEISNSCNSATLQPVVVGGNAPFTYVWTGPNNYVSTTLYPQIEFSGLYTVIVTSIETGCTATFSYTLELSGGGPCGAIEGKVIYDFDSNCVFDAGEQGLGTWLVRAGNATDTIYGSTNLQGKYRIAGPVGQYALETLPPNGLWAPCPVISQVNIAAGDTTSADDILVKSIIPCPSLSVSIGANLLRRCLTGSYYVSYCNEGTVPAPDAYILITLDPFLTPLFSSHPYEHLGNNVLRFSVGELQVGECGTFSLNVQVSCNATLGQTHCTEAHIYPDDSCIPSNPSWSGASLRVTSQCSPDSVRFNIKNIGQSDMPDASDYIVLEDAAIVIQAPFQLAAGDSVIVATPANGSTWRVEVEQEPFHPGMSTPALSVEGCSDNVAFSTGFVTQFYNNDADTWIDIDCTPNTGSFDPNDKQGFPVGYGPEHYIRPGTELEYMIRFQNTGTDTAFTVRVADTLSSWLDPATIRPGVSSHPYAFDLSGQGIATFLFENILLPDSNVNQVASNGFVKFSIYPKADAPLETLIENDAAIYFDFNEPVITNTTYHRLGENFMVVGLWQPQRPEYRVSVSPNPFSGTARLEVKGLISAQPLHLQIIDLQGVIVHDETTPGPVLTLQKSGLPAGMYLFKLDQKGVLIGSGKLIVRD